MRAKRAAVLAAMLIFVALTVTMSILALSPGGEEPLVASHAGAEPVAAPQLDPGAGAASRHEDAAIGLPGFVLWIVALVSVSGACVSFVVFRGEVRKEKAAIRAKKNRADYYKDLRKYNAQLKGPPRDNT